MHATLLQNGRKKESAAAISGSISLAAIDDHFKTGHSPLAGFEVIIYGRFSGAHRGLKIFVPQALSRFAIWSGSGSVSCRWNGEIVKTGFLTQYGQHKLKEVPMGLDIGENSVVVYFDSLHTYLRFKRLHDLGLTPGDPTFNCDPSYADYKAGVELRSAQTRPDYEAALNRAEVSPQICGDKKTI